MPAGSLRAVALFRRRRAELPQEWPAIAARMVVGRHELEADELAAHDALTGYLLDQVYWEPAKDMTITEEMRLVICGNAALLGLGIGPDAFRLVRTVIVHDSVITSRGSRPGRIAGTMDDEPHYNAGEAHDGLGPILLSWRDARYEARHPATGRNVVLHEFAHKLDMADGLSDGTPPIRDATLRRRWIDICSRTLKQLRADDGDDPVIREYAATNPTEFFAVLVETFFCAPLALQEHHPELYAVMSDALGQDPAERLTRRRAG